MKFELKLEIFLTNFFEKKIKRAKHADIVEMEKEVYLAIS